MWPGKRCLGIVAALAVGTPVQAAELGARALGRGGVGAADGADAAGVEQNLAAVALDQRYVLFAGAGLGPDSRLVLGGGAVDTRTSAVGLGAGYERLTDDVAPTGADLPGWKAAGSELANPTTWQRVHLGLAVPFLKRRMSVAANAHYDWRTSLLSGESSAFNFGFSMAGRPVETLTLSLFGRDLLGANYARTTRTVGLGARWTPTERFGLEADIAAPADADFGIDRFAWRAGLDGTLTPWLALRGGWSMESGTHFASAGLALMSEKAELDYGIKVELGDFGRNWHGLDLRVNF